MQPSNEDLGAFVEAEFAGYVDSGIWYLEEYLATRDRQRLHLKLSLEDSIED